MFLKKYLSIFEWGAGYNRVTLTNDLVAALIVVVLLIPQSLAYALLAGLPPEMGIYASIAPIVAYSIFGSSRVLAVGPVAVLSLMTATAIANVAEPGSPDYITAALTLAFLSGIFLVLLGLFRLGFLANFLPHPVIAGFITATGILIAVSQLKHILGINISGHNLPEMLSSTLDQMGSINWLSFTIGSSAILLLVACRMRLKSFLQYCGVSPIAAELAAKISPAFVVIISIVIAWMGDLDRYGLAVVGHVPQGLPSLTKPSFSPEVWSSIFGSAILISIIGYVESISVAQTLGAKKRQRIDPNQELLGLGAANIGAAFSGGFPVTGGFSRSVVNFDAGAESPAAGIFTAFGLALAALFFTPLIFFLPKATLAATIIVAVISLIDLSIFPNMWRYSQAECAAVAATIGMTLLHSVPFGISIGVLGSLAIHLYKTSRPHIALVGQVGDTEHFRNVLHYDVNIEDSFVSLRVDGRLYFANAQYLEDYIYALLAEAPKVKHLVLMCSAINDIDLSALESLELINERLSLMGIKFHLSEVKHPVMARLAESQLLAHLNGSVFLSQHDAIKALSE